MGQQYIYSTRQGGKLWQFFIFIQLEPISYYFVITKTLILSHVKWKLMQLDQYSSRKNIKSVTRKQYPYPQYRRKIMRPLFIFMELDPFSYYFMITKTLNLSHNKQKQVQLGKYSPIKISRALCDNDIHTPQDGR